MAKKKLKTDGIFFTGKSSEEVTGSQYLVRFGDCQILLECGLHQSRSNSYLDSYKINSEKFKFKPAEIDYVFLCHAHVDHAGLLPRLVKEGFHGEIITTPATAAVMKPLLLNSCYILGEEAKILSKRYKREYAPIYTESDVHRTLALIHTYGGYDTVYQLNNTVRFQWLHNSHCIGAAQLQLLLSTKEKSRKIFYTSDIGSLTTNNHYVDKTEIPNFFNDVVIMESTYGDPKRENKKKRSYDVDLLKTAVDTTLSRGGTAILPCFSFSRTQELLTTLYDIYGSSEDFTANVIVDSKLSCEISKMYSNIVPDSDFDKWNSVYNWKNVTFISEKSDSQKFITSVEPKVVLSASGFCTNGRVVSYLKQFLKDRNSTIIFSGYVGDNPTYLSYRIKNYREHKTIKIDGTLVPNRADCVTLSTFSSHASHSDLVKYGSTVRTNKLILVHGSKDGKEALAQELEEAISKNDNTHKVQCAFRGMICHL